MQVKYGTQQADVNSGDWDLLLLTNGFGFDHVIKSADELPREYHPASRRASSCVRPVCMLLLHATSLYGMLPVILLYATCLHAPAMFQTYFWCSGPFQFISCW